MREAPAVWDFRSDGDVAQARAVARAKSSGWVRFNIGARVRPETLYFVHTDAHDGVFWKMHTESNDDLALRCPVGVTAGSLPSGERWRPYTNARTFAMRIAPESFPYAAQNVVRVTADRLRLNAFTTNGVDAARVYEVRVYDEA